MAKGKNSKKVNNKNTIKRVEEELEKSDSLKSKIIVVVGVLAFLAIFYLLAVHITNKNSTIDDSNSTSSNTTSDYSEILFGSTFNRSEKEYLVIYYDKSNLDLSSSINSSITDYSNKDNSLTVYTVDMSNMYNKGYVTSDETNKSPSNIDELRVNGPTLIKISDGAVSEYIEGSDEIEAYLG